MTATPGGLTNAIVADVRSRVTGALPDDVVETARHTVLDWFGIAIAGMSEPLVDKLRAEASEQGGNPVCTIIWHGEKTSPMFAALINGSAADALDFSDANMAMRGHTSPCVVAASLAMAETRNASGKDFLRAVIAGVETECRVGLLLSPAFLRKGFHPTGNIAPFGGAGASAYLLGLDPAHTAQALGIVATQAAGLLASGGTMSKPFHSGKAAMNGILAAKLAQRDYIGRADAIEAPEGFLETHGSGRNEDALYSASGRYLILGTRFKAHAACQLTHSTIDNMLALKRDHSVMPDAIERIDVEVPPSFLSVCNIAEPRTGLEGKFSLRATAAMALLGDDTRDIGAYTAERMTHLDIIRLRDRVTVTPRAELTGGNANATITLTDGRTLTATNDCYKKPDSIALQREMVIRKFHSLVAPILGNQRALALQESIFAIDRALSIKPLIECAMKTAYRARSV